MTCPTWSPQAADDLIEALDYLVARNPLVAAKLAGLGCLGSGGRRGV